MERVTAYKYLGILITSDLSWSSHIQAITTKARKQTGMLYRRFYNNSQPSTLKILYVALIRPLLEYGVPVWDPHLRKDINLLESVQRFATKLCTKSWSAHERLHLLNLDSLSKRRAFLKLCHLYKLVHGQSASYNLPINFSNNSLYPTRLNHSLTLEVPFSHSNSYFYSFFVMQLGCGIHYLIILFHLIFTPLNRIYLRICHTCFTYPLYLIIWVQFNNIISNVVLSWYPLSVSDIKYYREKK